MITSRPRSSMGNPKKKRLKQPQASAGKHVGTPSVNPHGSTNNLKPIFNLEYLRGDYCLTKCSGEEKAAFADRLHRLSQLTWREIQLAPKHGVGHETISRDS